jgi:hypothetical protein
MLVNDTATKVFVFSPIQAHALLRLLKRAFSQDCQAEHGLTIVIDQLTDCLWLSGWMRENVILELHSKQIVDLSEALVAMLNERQWGDDDRQVLHAIIDRLSASIVTPINVDTITQKSNKCAVA